MTCAYLGEVGGDLHLEVEDKVAVLLVALEALALDHSSIAWLCSGIHLSTTCHCDKMGSSIKTREAHRD